jgi:hypothetical protein
MGRSFPSPSVMLKKELSGLGFVYIGKFENG